MCMRSLSFREVGLLILTITLVSTILLPTEIKCDETLQLNIRVEKESYDINELIRISGRVLTNTGTPVSNAIISIQVLGPNFTTSHIALRYSDETGAFLEEYYTPEGAPTGTYTVYVKVSKAGFEDIGAEIVYSIIPEFHITYAIILLTLLLLLINFQDKNRIKVNSIYYLRK